MIVEVAVGVLTMSIVRFVMSVNVLFIFTLLVDNNTTAS